MVLSPVVTIEAACVSGWSEYEGTCYHLNLANQDCSDYCAAAVTGEEPSLLCIENSDVNSFVAGLAVDSVDYSGLDTSIRNQREIMNGYLLDVHRLIQIAILDTHTLIMKIDRVYLSLQARTLG